MSTATASIPDLAPTADHPRRNRRAALLSILSNGTLTVLKLVLGLVTGSAAVLSEAAHSASDLLASFIALFSVRASARPADDDHPYGHHKAENLGAGLEGLLVLGAGLVVAVEAGRRLLHGGEPIVHLELAIGVMALSAAVNILIARHLYRVARRTGSPAIEGDAAHLSADVWTSAGTAVGLTLVALTGWHALDSVIALAVAVYVIWLGLRLTGRATQALLDASPPPERMVAIRAVLEDHSVDGVSFHALRARMSGSTLHIDLHMVVPPETTVRDGHRMSGVVKSDLRRLAPGADILIHLEDH